MLPVLAEGLKTSGGRWWSLFRKVLLWTAGGVAIVLVVQIFFADGAVRLMLPGYEGGKREMAASLLRYLTPAVLFLCLSSVAYTTLNAHKRFMRAALPDAVMKAIIIVVLFAMIPVLGIYAVALAAGVGGAACLAAQLWLMPRRTTAFGESGEETGPLVLGVAFSHINGVVDNLLASKLPAGSVSYLGYSRKLIDAILLVGPVALVTVFYSHLSHLASSGHRAEFKRLVVKGVKILLLVSVPGTLVLVGLREPIVRVLFERGEFGAESTTHTSYAFAVYAVGLVTFSLDGLVVYAFYAMSNTRTPVTVGVICVILDIVLAVLLFRPLGYLGIAGAFVIAKTVKVGILFGKLNTELEGLFSEGVVRFWERLRVAAYWLAVGGVVAACVVCLRSENAISIQTPWILVAAAAFVLVPLARKTAVDIVQKLVAFYLVAVLVNETAPHYFRVSLPDGSANVSYSVAVMIPLALGAVLSRERLLSFAERTDKMVLLCWGAVGAIIVGHMVVCRAMLEKFYGYGYEHDWGVLGNLCLYFLLFLLLWKRFDSRAFRRVVGVILLAFYIAVAMGYRLV
jgi:putative peptidoglycan lipid II flippase